MFQQNVAFRKAESSEVPATSLLYIASSSNHICFWFSLGLILFFNEWLIQQELYKFQTMAFQPQENKKCKIAEMHGNFEPESESQKIVNSSESFWPQSSLAVSSFFCEGMRPGGVQGFFKDMCLDV